MNRSMATVAFGVLALVCGPIAQAQVSLSALPAQAGAWGFDPSVLVADGQALLTRAPDREMDQLFQAVHASAQVPAEAEALCGLFDPQATHGLDALQAATARLGVASQERFALALTAVLVAAAQSPPQPFDQVFARQALKSAGATAAILHDGFLAGLNGDDRDARCRAVGQLLDGLQTRPLPERAAATRLLLREGLAQLNP